MYLMAISTQLRLSKVHIHIHRLTFRVGLLARNIQELWMGCGLLYEEICGVVSERWRILRDSSSPKRVCHVRPYRTAGHHAASDLEILEHGIKGVPADSIPVEIDAVWAEPLEALGEPVAGLLVVEEGSPFTNLTFLSPPAMLMVGGAPAQGELFAFVSNTVQAYLSVWEWISGGRAAISLSPYIRSVSFAYGNYSEARPRGPGDERDLSRLSDEARSGGQGASNNGSPATPVPEMRREGGSKTWSQTWTGQETASTNRTTNPMSEQSTISEMAAGSPQLSCSTARIYSVEGGGQNGDGSKDGKLPRRFVQR